MTALDSPPLLTGTSAPIPVRRRRSSRLLLLAVVLAILGGLAGVVAYRAATAQVSVVAVARAVPFGQSIQPADLRELRLPADAELATVSWDDVDRVVGRVAATDLAADTALSPAAVTDAGPPRAGDAVVGLSLAPGRAPALPLSVRDEVLVITPDAASPIRATVLRPGSPDGSGRLVVDLLVSDGLAVDLARAAVDDRAVLVLVAGR